MTVDAKAPAPGWFPLVAWLALAWNLYGAAHYLGHVGMLGGAFAEPQPGPMPSWATGAFALGVFSGVLGALGLLLRQRWAVLVLWVSLFTLIADWGWVFFASGAGVQAIGIVVIGVAAALVWLAHRALARGWLA